MSPVLPVPRSGPRRSVRPSVRPFVRRALATASVLALVGGLSACSGTGGSADSAGSDSGGTAAGVAADAGGDFAAKDAPVASDSLATGDAATLRNASQAADPVDRQVISTGQVRLQSKDLSGLRADLDRLLARHGGYVADERTVNDKRGRTERSTLTTRVPAAAFATVMDSFQDYATVLSATVKAEDVTTEVIDVQSRLRTETRSLARLRSFLRRADTVPDLVRVEQEIAQRQAERESLAARAKYLADQTSLATITVVMDLPPDEVVKDDPLADAGFLSGLRGGWSALGDATVVALTAVGAALPFALVVGLVGTPLLWWVRRTRGRRTPPPAPTPTEA